MKRFFSEHKIASPLNALNARKVLGDLCPVSERRKGGYGRAVLYGLFALLSSLGLFFYFLLTIADANLGDIVVVPYIIIGGLLCLCIGIFITVREQNIAAQNEIEELKKILTPNLNEGEKFLLLQLGHAYGMRIPSWFPEQRISDYSHFIFTTDRLLIVTFERFVIGANLINNYLETGQYDSYDSYVNGLYSIDLLDPKAFKIGGYIKAPLFNIGYTKCTVSPMGENETYTWLLGSGFTQNGKLLKTIRHRLKYGYSQEL